jgi:HSP20 family protein
MMAHVAFDPFDGLLRLQRDLDRMFGKPSLYMGMSGPSVFPPINIFSDKDGVVIRAEVPGIKADELTIDVDRGRVMLSGERKAGDAPKEGGYHRRERRIGKFSRTLRLPDDLDPHEAKAELRDGVLTLRIPKAASARPRHIEVKAA